MHCKTGTACSHWLRPATVGTGTVAWPLMAALLLLPACSGGDGHGGAAQDGFEVRLPGKLPPTGSRTSGSIILDVTPDWSGDDASDDVLVDVTRPFQFDNRLSVVKNRNYLRFVIADDTGRETDLSVPIQSWNPGVQRTVVATWGEGCVHLFVDGELIASGSYPGELLLQPGTPITGDYGTPSGAAAAVTRVTLYGRPLEPEDVHDDFAAHSDAVVLSTSASVSEDGLLSQLCVTLNSNGHQVAGTQNDLIWDGTCARLIEDTCTIDPHTGKTLFTGVRDDSLRTLVLDFDNTAPIDDGPLYCCTFVMQPTDSGQCCSFLIANTGAADPRGNVIPSQATGGRVCTGAAAASSCQP